MDKVKIVLPCGFEKTYDRLHNGEKVIRCTMCHREDLTVEDVLNRPENRLRLKLKQFELECENLKKLQSKIHTIKQDPRVYVEQNFETIINDLDVRREELKRKFEKNLDSYYTSLRTKLDDLKVSTINKLVENLTQDTESIDVLFKKLINVDNSIEIIQSNLEQLTKKIDQINELIMLAEIGKTQQLFFYHDSFEIEDLFGTIVQNDPKFDYEENFYLEEQYDFNCVVQVDENRILNGSSDGIIQMWDLNEAKCLMTFTDQEEEITCLLMLSDNLFASSFLEDSTIKIWNIENGACENMLIGHKDFVNALICLSNRRLASCSWDSTIKIWNYENGQCIKTLNGPKTYRFYTIEKGTNNTLIIGSLDGSIIIWNYENEKMLKKLCKFVGYITSLKMFNSNKLASGFSDGTIKICDLESGKHLKTLYGHKMHSSVRNLAMLKSGHLISGCDDGTIRFWDINVGKCLKIINSWERINFLLLTKDEKILTSNEFGDVNIWSRKVV